jgi:hypothetical protein
LHNITVYANDIVGNTGTSETIYFAIEILPPERNGPPSEPFPTTWIIAAIAIIATGVAITLGATIYRRKRLPSNKTPN